MDFDKYINRVPYPNVRDYTTVYFYKDGKLFGLRAKDGGQYLVKSDGTYEAVDVIRGAGAAEKVVDKAAFDEARNAYGAEESRIYEEFKRDLFHELDIEDNPKKGLLFQKAWEWGHASGYSEVYSVASDLVELIL